MHIVTELELFTKQYNLVPSEGLHAKSAVLLAAA